MSVPVGDGLLPVGAGLCRSVSDCAGRYRTVPVGAELCRSVPDCVGRCRTVSVGAGADRNRVEIARNAVYENDAQKVYFREE